MKKKPKGISMAEAMAKINQASKAKEQKSKVLERKSFKTFIDPKKDYCNSVPKFLKWLQIDKKTLSAKELLLKLREYEVQYSNACTHYNRYGPDRLADTYEKIIHIISKEQEPLLISNESQPAQTIQKQKPDISSYAWDPQRFDEVTKLYNKIKGNLINEGTTVSQFKKVFSGISLREIEPIKWDSNNASQLLYFITELQKSNCIKKGNRMNYERLKKCFIKNDGSPFNESLRNIKQNLDRDFSKEKRKSIDEIIRSLRR